MAAKVAGSNAQRSKNSGIKTSVKSSTLPPVPELEKPLVQVSITNPLKKIMYWLDQIRRKQTTTFAIKLSIPLIALPVIAIVFFQLGKNFALPKTLDSTPQPSPKASITPSSDLIISRAGILKIAQGKETRYLLNLRDGRIIILEMPPQVDVKKYQNKQILVTGPYNRTTSIMKVEDIAEIELFNEVSTLPTPSPTPVASLIPSPTATSSAQP
ncbi:hypothetical protein HYS91_00740 [Candidatus Daviesbacteria bacterium]|nr:hypothetical protein [Candidatus Daviesbacteria bacterium]